MPAKDHEARFPTNRPRFAVAALASTATLTSYLQTIMTPLVPVFPETFDATPAAVAWVFTAPMLTASATAPAAGRLGDMLGKKRVLLALLVISCTGSLIGALANSLALVIAARALQGVGLGVMALNVSIMRDVMPPARLPAGITTLGASNGIGGALGLPISAAVGQWADWHGLFWLALAFAALSFLAIIAAIPDERPTERSRFDSVGSILLGAGLVAVILAIGQVPDWGVAPSVALGCGGIASLALWIAHALRTPEPAVDVRVIASRPVLLVNLVTIATGFAWIAVPALLSRLLQTVDGNGPGFGMSMLATSFMIIPTGLSVLLFSPWARRVVARFGPRRALQVGGIITAGAYVWGLLRPETPWTISVIAGAVGLGTLLMMSSAPLIVFAHVPSSSTSAASSFNAVMRWVGATLSSATIGAVLATSSIPYRDNSVPTAVGYDISFAAVAVVAALGVVLASFLPDNPPRPHHSHR